MNMEQINMMMQMIMQQGQVSGSNTGKDSNGDSFQDMMSQKQDAVSSNKPSSNDQQTQSKPAQNDKTQQTDQQTPQENVPEVSDDVRQAMAALLLQPYVVQDVAVQQTAQENVDMVATMPTVDAAVAQTVQTAVAGETMAPAVQQEAAQPTVQVPQQAAPEQMQTAPEVTAPQEGVQQQGLQNASAQTEQQSTGEAATEQKMVEVDQPDDQSVVVTKQEQPLFRDVETVPVKVGDATPTVDVNAPDMEKQLADTIQAKLNTVGDKVQIQLQPENLGHITIELVQHGGKMGLVIFADNAKTTSLLAQHAGNLGALLEDRTGQTVHVQVQQQEPEQPQYDGHNQQNRQQQEEQSHPKQSKAEQDSFLGQLRLGLYQLDAV
ncbi:flagellar hook-length control protein FliK [uncultured Agathobaculum sp.]|uniref:flagellar hook-length control protein FliK n=1 Tax=uncultured Agathobaculum sp. TaxID=2048140 RepID=UPI00260D1C6C|nr:flagellar hook-length control protein FliK [uncultured Agathobaculum sp.]